MQSAGFFAKRNAANLARGYTVDYKYLGIALLTELAIVFTSVYGAYLFARIYSTDDLTFAMMMLAPIAYAGAELARVPLAFACRVQTSKFWKVVFAVMVLCAAGVTVKSLSQLGEIMFRPRLRAVTEASIRLGDVRAEQATVASRIAAADSLVSRRSDELASADDRVKQANAKLAGLPPDRCATLTRRTKEGTRRFRQCNSDSRRTALSGDLTDAQAAHTAAQARADAAQGTRATLDRADVDHRVAQAEFAHREAVMNSQLHSFTGMFFGKDPTQVTDGEVHFFLRWFVFFPAIFASLAATALALASVNYEKPTTPDSVEIDEAVLRSYVLAPLVEEVTQRLRAEADVESARHPAASAGPTVADAGTPPSSVNDNPPESPPLKAVGDAR